eukprot:SAG11_NODE_3113_length_2693_cov_1.331136_1_plen_129_part_00
MTQKGSLCRPPCRRLHSPRSLTAHYLISTTPIKTWGVWNIGTLGKGTLAVLQMKGKHAVPPILVPVPQCVRALKAKVAQKSAKTRAEMAEIGVDWEADIPVDEGRAALLAAGPVTPHRRYDKLLRGYG